jgi:hypothetical protein
MGMLLAGVEYFAAALVGMVMAIFPTVLVSYAVFPPDGPIGEGFAIMLIYFIAFCACVPGYAVLMRLHRQGRRDTRGLIASEIILRTSFLVAACFICFMAIKLPTAIGTKWLTCLAVAPLGAWAIKPTSFKSHFDQVE